MSLSVTTWLDTNVYPSFADNWDDWAARQKILEYLRPEAVVLDLGAGAGVIPHMNFSGLAERIVGVDPDPVVLGNSHVHESRVGSGEAIPFEDASFDLVFSNNVLEHLSEPRAVFAEVHRVLKPGGVFIVKTPNRFHYVATLARLTPLRMHKFINRLRGRSESDTYPTQYRANSWSALQRLAAVTNFSIPEISFIEGRPEYLRLFWPTYVLGIIYERLVNSSRVLSRFRVVIIAVFKKEV